MKIWTDGACNDSKKRSGIGIVFEDGEHIAEEIIHGTNNDAEYKALIRALERCIERGFTQETTQVLIFTDSSLVVNQVNKKWKINFEHLQRYNDKIDVLRQKVNFSISFVPREENEVADYWSKVAIGTATKRMHVKFFKPS